MMPEPRTVVARAQCATRHSASELPPMVTVDLVIHFPAEAAPDEILTTLAIAVRDARTQIGEQV